MISDPDNLLTDPDHRDIVISVLNALDNRAEAGIRARALLDIGSGILTGTDPGKWIGALLGLSMRICDDNDETKETIDEFRDAVREAATRG